MRIDPASSRILAALLEAQTGQELPPSRQWRIGTALSGVLRETGLNSLDELATRLGRARDTALSRKVVEALLNNETYFFRDKAMFDLLAKRILPELAERRASSRTLSIWSAGCSTGQEALSLAMMFAEQEARWAGWTIDILATDVARGAIDTARSGFYSQFEIQRGLGMTQMVRWFDQADNGWQADARLRDRVRFNVHNLLDPPPSLGRIDLVLCRNVLLYFDGANRGRAFERLSSAMAPDGWLMLGTGETVVGQTDCFTPDRGIVGFYRPSHGISAEKPAISNRNTRFRKAG